MAKISMPDYSERQLVGQSPNVNVDPGVASTSGRMFADLGAGLGELAGQLEKAHSLAETAKADNIAEAGIAQIQQQALLDTDTSEAKRSQYHQQIQSVYDDAANNISIPQVRNSFTAKAQSASVIEKIKVDNAFRDRVISGAKADILVQEQNMGQKYIMADSSIERERQIQDFYDLTNQKQAAGFITAEEATKQKLTTVDKWNSMKVMHDAQTNPDKFLSDMGAGFYKGIDADIIDKATRSAEIQIRQNTVKAHFAERIRRADDTHELVDLANNGLLKADKLEEYFKTKRISNSLYNDLQQKIDSVVGPTADTDPQTYYDLTNSLLDEKVDREKVTHDILKANADGKLSALDAKKIYEMHLTPSGDQFTSLQDQATTQTGDDFAKIKNAYDAKNKSIEDKRKWLKPAIDAITSFFTGPTKLTDTVSAIKQLYDNISKNKTPNDGIQSEADKIIGQENLKKYPNIFAGASENGTDGWARGGIPVTVYKDGRVVRKK